MQAVHGRAGRHTKSDADDNEGGDVQLKVFVLASEGLDRKGLEMCVGASASVFPRASDYCGSEKRTTRMRDTAPMTPE